MAVASVNIWTGSPLFAVWVGSQVQQAQGQPSMLAVFVVVVVLAVMVLLLATVLSSLSATYDQITGRPPAPRQPAPWMRSMRAERQSEVARQHGLNGMERILVVTVVLAVVGFETWFFFFSGSPI